MNLARPTHTTRFSILLLSTALTLFPSCALFRKGTTTTTTIQQTHTTTPTPEQPAQTRDSLFRQALTARQAWSDTMRTLAFRAQIHIQRWAPHSSDTITHKGKLLLRWQRQNGLWCILQGPMDVEVVRLWLLPDTLIALNRMEKIAYVGHPSQVFTLLNLPGLTHPDSLFAFLERLLLLLPLGTKYKWKANHAVYLKKVRTDLLITQTFSEKALPHTLSIERITPLDTISIFQIQFLNDQNQAHYPEQWQILGKLFRGTLRIQTIKWNSKATIPNIRIPSSYQIQPIRQAYPDTPQQKAPNTPTNNAPTSQ